MQLEPSNEHHNLKNNIESSKHLLKHIGYSLLCAAVPEIT